MMSVAVLHPDLGKDQFDQRGDRGGETEPDGVRRRRAAFPAEILALGSRGVGYENQRSVSEAYFL